MPNRTRIFLVEDRPGLLDAIEVLLRAQPEFVVVGRSLSRENAQAKARARNPHLVVMDWDNCMDGVKSIDALKNIPSAPRIIVLGGQDHPHFHAAVKALGAMASLDRRKAPTHLLPIIFQANEVHNGNDIACPDP